MKNKKLFAILTLVCFMFTLMPVAAFASTATPTLSSTASVFATVDADAEVTKSVGSDPAKYEYITSQISLKTAGGSAVAATTTETVYVWAEAVAGQSSDAFVVTKGVNADLTKEVETVTAKGEGVYEVKIAAGTSVGELSIAFLRTGEYTLKAALVDPTGKESDEYVVFAGASANKTTVTVNNNVTDTSKWGVEVNGLYELQDGESTTDKYSYEVPVSAVGVKETTVKLVVKSWNGTALGNYVANYPITLDTDSSNIEVSAEKLTTDHNGEATFKLSATREGLYKVYVSFGEVEAVINVEVGGSVPNDIEVIEAPEAPLATTGINYDNEIRFQVTDVNGNIVKEADLGNCVPDGAAPTTAEAPYVTILEQPATSKLKDKNIWIKPVTGEDYYVLDTDVTAFDKEGTYSVKVILDNGRSAVVTWEVKKFQTPVEIVIDAPESVELGTDFDVELTFVDANGVEKTADKDIELAATGYAIQTLGALNATTAGSANVQVKADEKYVGSVITLTAVSERYGLIETAEVKVAKEAVAIAFDFEDLAVDVNNKIEWNVVDEDGTPVDVKINTGDTVEINYVVLDKPEGAKVSVYDATTAFDGDGVMAVTSNKVGNVTVQAIVKLVIDGTPDVTKYYTGIVVLPIGSDATGDVVVLSIGSNQLVVNNKVVEIQTAPVVKDSRTFVPFRALLNAFGIDVEWDAATQSVTAVKAGTTVVLTIGSNVLTVNGAEVTIDVAPYLTADGWTMVPVRAITEAFGYEVIYTTDANGAVADVLFV